ncbi:MAG: DUF1285 domain-containing protein [Rhodospirillaceae bacterium]
MSHNIKDITSLLHSGKTENSGRSVEKIDPETGRFLCGDLDIRIDRDGTWFYHGSPIGRKELVRLFSTVLQRDDGGRYWLITPIEQGEIVVEDVPFQAVEMDVTGDGRDQVLEFRTNVDEIVKADAAHPLRISYNEETGEPSPYVLVRDNLEARLTRSVYYQLVELGEERELDGETVYGVWSAGEFYKIGRLTE